MHTAYTNWLQTHAEDIDWDGLTVRFSFFVRSSGFLSGTYEGNDVMVESATSVQDLLAHPGWQAAVVLPVTGTVLSSTSAGTTTVTLDGPVEAQAFPTYLAAVAVSLMGTYDDTEDPLLAVYRPEGPFLFGGSEQRPARILQNNADGREWLFQVTSGDVDVSTVEVAVPVLGWESAHAVHVWLSPARINYVANPSFEAVGVADRLFGWRTNAELVAEGSAGNRVGSLSGGDGTKVIESNVFPAANERGFWSTQARVSGPGTYRFGILFWLPGMDPDDCFFVSNEYVSESSGFQTLKTMFAAPEEAWAAQFRLEFTPPEDDPEAGCLVDDVLVEPGEHQGAYFDGSVELGQPGDTNWYGYDALVPAQVEHRSFSTYYPDRSSTSQYLFKAPADGAAYRYVPETVQLVPHWDDVYYFKIRSWTQNIRIPVVDFPALGKDTVVTLSE